MVYFASYPFNSRLPKQGMSTSCIHDGFHYLPIYRHMDDRRRVLMS